MARRRISRRRSRRRSRYNRRKGGAAIINYSKFGFAVTLQPEANNAQIPLPENHINEIINSYIGDIPEQIRHRDELGMQDINIHFQKINHNHIAALLGQPLINPPPPPIDAFICKYVQNANFTADSIRQFLGEGHSIEINGRHYLLRSYIIPDLIIDALPE